MTEEIKPPTVSEMADALAHAGVKGMKWGVRQDKSGGGTISVKGRPTYSRAEILGAKKAVKDYTAGVRPINKLAINKGKPNLKAENAKIRDKDGYKINRLAKLNTVQRRLVNGVIGTKYTLAAQAAAYAGSVAAILGTTAGTTAATGTAVVGSISTAGVIGLGLSGVGTALLAPAAVHATYKVFFQNMKNNPKIKVKTSLSADDLAKFQTGKTFSKVIRDKHGTVKISSLKGKQTIDIFDLEGRKVGTRTKTVPKPPKSK